MSDFEKIEEAQKEWYRKYKSGEYHSQAVARKKRIEGAAFEMFKICERALEQLDVGVPIHPQSPTHGVLRELIARLKEGERGDE